MQNHFCIFFFDEWLTDCTQSNYKIQKIVKLVSHRSLRLKSQLQNYFIFFYFILFYFIDIFKEGSLISDPALLSIRALYIQNTNTTRFKNYKQDTLEYISNGKITKKSMKIAYKAQVILPIK